MAISVGWNCFLIYVHWKLFYKPLNFQGQFATSAVMQMWLDPFFLNLNWTLKSLSWVEIQHLKLIILNGFKYKYNLSCLKSFLTRTLILVKCVFWWLTPSDWVSETELFNSDLYFYLPLWAVNSCDSWHDCPKYVSGLVW